MSQTSFGLRPAADPEGFTMAKWVKVEVVCDVAAIVRWICCAYILT